MSIPWNFNSYLNNDININIVKQLDSDMPDTTDTDDDFGSDSDAKGNAIADTVENSQDITNDSTDMNTAANGVSETEQQFNFYADIYDRAYMVKQYVARYGIDSALFKLQDYDGLLSNVLSFKMPERPSRKGPFDRNAIIAVEEADSFLGSVWEWIKKTLNRLKDFFREFWTKFINLFSKQGKQLSRFKNILHSRHDDKDKSGNEIEVISSSVVDTNLQAVSKVMGSVLEDNISKVTSDNLNTIQNTNYKDSIDQYEKDIRYLNGLEWDTANDEVDDACNKAKSLISKGEDCLETAKNFKSVQNDMKTLITTIDGCCKTQISDSKKKKAKEEAKQPPTTNNQKNPNPKNPDQKPGTASFYESTWSKFSNDANWFAGLEDDNNQAASPAQNNQAASPAQNNNATSTPNKEEKPTRKDSNPFQEAAEKSDSANPTGDDAVGNVRALRALTEAVRKRSDVCVAAANVLSKLVRTIIKSVARYISKGTISGAE